jgi:hypothetical protein
MPSRSPDQAAGWARSAHGHALHAAHVGINEAIARRRPDVPVPLARAKAKRLPMKPEAPVMSTRPFNSASFGKGEERDAGGHEAEADA